MMLNVLRQRVPLFCLTGAVLGCGATTPAPQPVAEPTPASSSADGEAGAFSSADGEAERSSSAPARFLYVPPEQLFQVAGLVEENLADPETQALVDLGATVGFRTGYYRNGCQSRAHVLWAALPQSIRSKVGKIWAFQPSAYAPLMKQGAIHHPDDPEIRWDFHVALLFRNSRGAELIVDLALGNEPMSLEQWVSAFRFPDNTLVIKTDGAYYSYNSIGGAVNAMYAYTGEACRGAWMIEDVAFDRVGAQLLAKPDSCDTLRKFANNVVAAKAELKSPDFSQKNPGAGCAALKDVFFKERERILTLVDEWARPDGCN